MSALLEHCLPGTSFDKALEHATHFERKRENELDEKKSKRTSQKIQIKQMMMIKYNCSTAQL